jgi:hypothetical protein
LSSERSTLYGRRLTGRVSAWRSDRRPARLTTPNSEGVFACTLSAMHLVLIHAPGRDVDTGRTQNSGYDYEEVVAALARFDDQGHTHEVIESRRSLTSDVVPLSPMRVSRSSR